jgi:hypothetical protein
MAKHHKSHKKEKFEPKIGFENSVEGGMSFSFSEFEIQGNPQRSNSFFSESEKESVSVDKSESERSVNVSNGLNHAFFEENSESVSIRSPVKIARELNENTAIEVFAKNKGKKEKDQKVEAGSEEPEIILANEERVEERVGYLEEEGRKKSGSLRKKKSCCKCASCYIF